MAEKEEKPKKAQSPEHNIYRSLRLNRLIVWGCLLATVIVSIGAMYYNHKNLTYTLNHALVLSADGKVLPLEFVERNRVIEIQMREHLRYFYGSYYTFDQNNMLTQREAGLWLIDGAGGQALEEFYDKNGWYNDIIRKSLEQETTIIEGTLEFGGNQAPYNFKCTVEIKVNPIARPDLVDTYHMGVVGQISTVQATWPVNTEGLIIHNYRESAWQKIQTE